MWIIYAALSAIFAGLVSVLAKCGMDGISSDLATAVRTCVVLVIAWGIVLFRHETGSLASLSKKGWLFLILSGICTGISWLCYFKAIKLGRVSQVAAIDKLSVVFAMIFAFLILKEHADIKTIAGCVLIVLGTLVMIL